MAAEHSPASEAADPSATAATKEEVVTGDEDQYLWERRHRVLERTIISSLYHRKRERFFGFWDRAASALALIAGSAAFSELLPEPEQKALAGAAVAVVSLPGLVFGWGESSRRHASLAARFKGLEADIEGQGERDFDEGNVNSWERQIRILETEEPPVLSTLVEQVQYEVALSKWTPDSGESAPVPVVWWKRRLMHWIDLGASAPPRK